MSNNKYEIYLAKKKQYEEALKWTQMKINGGGRERSDTFDVSPAHSKVSLKRCGQYSTGGQNYWETSKEFNKYIVGWIVENIEQVQSGALEMMKKDLDVSLIDLKDFVERMNEEIDSAEQSRGG